MTHPLVSTGSTPVVTALGLVDLYQVFENAANIGVSAYLRDRLQLVTVQGALASMGTEYGQRLYEVALEHDGFTIYLNVPKQLFTHQRVDVGDFVEVKGRPVVLPSRGKFRAVRLRLDVYEVQHADAPAEITRRKTQAITLERVRQLGTSRAGFPLKYQVRLALICGQGSQVEADFLHPLTALPGRLAVETIRTRMDDVESIVHALRAATGDLVALIRGGGDEEDFAVFDHPAVLEAFAQVQGYRLLGVGHSKHVTLLDLIVDYAATTPSAAGQFMAAQLGEVARLVDSAQAETRTELQALRADYDRELALHIAMARSYRTKVNHTVAAVVGVVVILLLLLPILIRR